MALFTFLGGVLAAAASVIYMQWRMIQALEEECSHHFDHSPTPGGEE